MNRFEGVLCEIKNKCNKINDMIFKLLVYFVKIMINNYY